MLVEHYEERIGENVLGPPVVPPFTTTPGPARWAGPAIEGSHNLEVLSELLGLNGIEIPDLHADGVV
jgi:formyl-CoA transferase